MIDGWKIRNVDYEYIHNIDEKDLDALYKSLEIKDGDVIADLMGGYGGVSKHITKYTSKVNIILLDSSPEQLQRVSQDNITTIVADMRDCPLEDNSIDKAVIKMGIHEVPKKDQQLIFNEVYRILKKGGIFSFWEALPSTYEEQLFFQDIVRKKDELAGFESFVKNRYFFRLDEGLQYMANAGFQEVEAYHTCNFIMTTHNRLETEFNNEQNKLEEWNDHIRERIPDNLKQKLDYKDNQASIHMRVDKKIIRGKKI